MKNVSDENLYHRELHTILKFSALINSSLKIESVLNNGMKWAEEFINAEASSIYELDEENNELFIRHARGEKKDPVKNIRLTVGEGIAGWVVKTGKPMVIHDTGKEKKFSDKYDRQTGFKTRSLICVPMILKDKIIGAIQVLNKKSKEPFSQADLEILTSMSQQIAVAIDNAKLYERLEKKFELTEQELRVTQGKLIRSERLAAMGHLVNGVAHEIRNPITVIGGFTRRIKERAEGKDFLIKYTDIILGEIDRLEVLVKKVRELSEVQSAELNPDHLEPVIDKVIKDFETQAENRNIRFSVSIEENLPLINMDMPQLVTAFSNILENAFESVRDAGEIILNVKKSGDERISITVKDNGSGIMEKDIASIYDPFVTSKTRGAGLGLTMVHQIIMNHNGIINITSRESEGTLVTVNLPAHNILGNIIDMEKKE